MALKLKAGRREAIPFNKRDTFDRHRTPSIALVFALSILAKEALIGISPHHMLFPSLNLTGLVPHRENVRIEQGVSVRPLVHRRPPTRIRSSG